VESVGESAVESEMMNGARESTPIDVAVAWSGRRSIGAAVSNRSVNTKYSSLVG